MGAKVPNIIRAIKLVDINKIIIIRGSLRYY